MTSECPKCHFSIVSATAECPRCGVVLAKWQPPNPRVRREESVPFTHPLPSNIVDEDEVTNGTMAAAEWKILGFGLLAAVIVYAIPFLRFVFSAMVTLFHELGHAVIGWILGVPSLPAFDFVYGGGFTHQSGFRLSVALAVAAAFVYLGWLFRRNPKSVAIIVATFLLWLFFVSAEWRRELAIASAGHLFEFILAAILFYQALSGTGWRNPELERPLGAFVGFFVQIHSTMFAWRLTSDSSFLEWYRQGKGGALMNDLEVVALDLHIWLKVNPGIIGVAKMLLVFSLLPIAVALLWHFRRATWHRGLRALRVAE